MEAMRPLVGTPVEDLDTPCLLLDMESVEHNMGVMARYYSDKKAKLRPHVKNHKTPVLAHMQIRMGGTVGGVCAAKVSEAEVMVASGIDDILIANQVVSKDKIRRLAALARVAEMSVGCDDERNARELSEAMASEAVEVGVLVEVDTQMGRCGVRSIEEGVRLAREIASLPGLRFKGIMSHQSIPPTSDRETRVLGGRRIMHKVLDLKAAIERDGLPVEVVSTGETWSYDVAGEIPGVTEVQGGTYLLMEGYYGYMSDFRPAAKILGTVISANRPGRAIGDVGIKAVGTPRGLPTVDGRKGVEVESLHAEHTILRLSEGARMRVGEKFMLVPGQQDIMVNRWDRFVAVRDGRVEAVWDIAARGCHS
ncbi:MAG: DSD1 family PLP-dependent enzyme [SAR202 cluster bacterium]|nr:DSD1 family PLP-dependent enzyme [SAR202 cluster bacterium]